MRRRHKKYTHRAKADRGFILITVLLLLGILSMTAYLAVDSSQFSIKTNSNRLAYLQAQYSAEESRRMAVALLQAELIGQANNPQAVSGVQLHSAAKQVLSSTNAIANRLQKTALVPFLNVNQAERQAEVSIMALPTQMNTHGVALAQHRAYQGAGQGLGSTASFSRYFELRAKGIAQSRGNDIAYWSAADYRFVP